MTRLKAWTLVVAGCAAVVVTACEPNRIRPAPPRVDITFPQGDSAFSPDTIVVSVLAQDANGIDSVIVTFLGNEIGLLGNLLGEFGTDLNFPIPEGLSPGNTLPVTAEAKDALGERTSTSATIRIIQSPLTGPGL